MTFATGLVIVHQTHIRVICIVLDVEFEGSDILGCSLDGPVIGELTGKTDVTLTSVDEACGWLPGGSSILEIEFHTFVVEVHRI